MFVGFFDARHISLSFNPLMTFLLSQSKALIGFTENSFIGSICYINPDWLNLEIMILNYKKLI